MFIGGARVVFSWAVVCSGVWTALSGCDQLSDAREVDAIGLDAQGLVSSGLQPSAASLPHPDQGACAFVPASTCVATKNPLCSTGVFRGDLIVRDAKDVASVKGCQRIAGDMVILSETLRDLSGLESLQVVEGNVIIGGRDRLERDYNWVEEGANQLLESLHGLEQLRCVGRGLLVHQGNVCKPLNASALAKLTEVGGAMSAESWCDGSPSAASFASLRRVWGDANISGVAALPSLDSVYGRSLIAPEVSTPKLSYVGCEGGAPMCRDGVLGCAVYAQSQADVDALKDCKLAVGELQLVGTDIADLRPLSKLREVRGNFGILVGRDGASLGDVGALTSLTGLEKLESAHALTLGMLPNLQTLAPLSNLRSLPANRDAIAFKRDVNYLATPELAELRLQGLPALRDLTGLRKVRQVQGTLAVASCDLLPNLRDLSGMTVSGLNLYRNAAMRSTEGPTYAATLADLTLSDMPVLRDLRGLQSVKELNGTGYIRECAQLSNLTELSGLRRAHELYISENPLLTTLTGLSALQSVDGTFEMWKLPSLKSIAALRALTSAGSLRMLELASLASLDGLQNLSTTPDGTVVSGLPSLVSLAGFSGLRQVGYLGLRELGKVRDLQGLSERAVFGSFELTNMPALTSLKGLPAQASGGFGEVQLMGNPVLSDLSALAWVKSVESLFIADSPQLRELTGLNALTHASNMLLSGSFSLRPLRALNDVGALDVRGPATATLSELVNVHTLEALFITGATQVSGITPPALSHAGRIVFSGFGARDFAGLPTLNVDGLSIGDSPTLESLDGLQDTVAAASAVYVERNPLLASLRGLETVHGVLSLFANDALRDLSALSGVTTLRGLSVYSNAQLESLTGLEQLTSIQSIDLYGNNQLRDVRALGNASFQSPDTAWISVNYNPVLPACEVAWLAAHFNYPLEQIGTNNGPEGSCEP